MTHRDCNDCNDGLADRGRRRWFGSALTLTAAGTIGGLETLMPGVAYADALTQVQRDAMTPDQVIAAVKAGNERFRSGKMQGHDYLAQKRASATGQYPAAAILSCIDSRAPAEIVLDTGIGDTFNARIAGNVADDDVLGSLEFACALAGAKLVLVMGHTACGAIKGAIDDAKLGNLTDLLEKIKPSVAATKFDGERSSKNPEFVDAVTVTHVRMTVEDIRKNSPVLAGLEKEGKDQDRGLDVLPGRRARRNTDVAIRTANPGRQELRLRIADVGTSQGNLTTWYPEVRGGLQALARAKH